jgi:hypothetical protein
MAVHDGYTVHIVVLAQVDAACRQRQQAGGKGE